MEINTIDEVIEALEAIIKENEKNEDPLGYFAVLYHKVTVKVKSEIENDFFDDGPRMEKLDVIFASRYLNAYNAYKKNEVVSLSWKKAFDISTNFWPIVLQHLLVGMNAHISLDLGIAAAEISNSKTIDDLEDDFNKINTILSTLVHGVQEDLAKIWPKLKWLLQKTGKADDFLVEFSMQLARDGAWKFAKELANAAQKEQPIRIDQRDEKVAKNAKIITNPGFIAKLILGIIRLGERGSVSKKINDLKQKDVLGVT